MSSIERRMGKRRDAVASATSWFDTHAASFQRGVLGFRSREYQNLMEFKELIKDGRDLQLLDPLFRSVSEMGVCRYWHEAGISFLFEPIRGTVHFVDIDVWGGPADSMQSHSYALYYSPTLPFNPVIVDHCVSQFVQDRETEPGKRRERVIAQAPDLFHTYQTPYGPLTLLVGFKDEIRKRLGIKYYRKAID